MCDVLHVIVAIDTKKKDYEKFAEFMAGLEYVAEKSVESRVGSAVIEAIVGRFRRCPVLKLRLNVTLAELVDFLVALQNLIFIAESEIPDGLAILFDTLSPGFPMAAEIREDLATKFSSTTQ
jgi:hypothetical protein